MSSNRPTSGNSAGTPAQTGAGRHSVRARALVAGLAPSVVPMIIQEWWPQGIQLGFDGQSGMVDERWALPGAGILVTFKGTVGGEARRVTVHGRIRTRDPKSLLADLLAVDEIARSALESLAAGSATTTPTAPASGKARPRAAAPEMTADAIAALCLALLRTQLPSLISVYVDGLGDNLRHLQSGLPNAPEHKRASMLLHELSRCRTQVEQTILEDVLPSVAAYLGDGKPLGSWLETSGLSLLESIDLRATLLVTEAVENVAGRLRGSWQSLESRLGQLLPQRNDSNALAPAVFCHHFRDAIFFDQQLGPLRQIDLTSGYSDAFVAHLDRMYRELDDLLERQGVQAAPMSSERNPRPPGRKQ